VSRLAHADIYPSRAVHVIVPQAAASSTDIHARLVGQFLRDHLGQAFVVDVKPGAGGNVGTEFVVHATPDGYTLLTVNSQNAISPSLYPDLTFNFLRDIVPIGQISLAPMIMEVNPSVPANTVPEFIAYAKANPGKINYGAGLGTPPHLLSTLFKTEAKIDVVFVPYTGSAQSVNDLLGGQTQFTIDGLVTLYPLIAAGKVRALAIARGERWPALPDVPTLVESGYPDFVIDAWTGLVAPAGTPRPIVDQLNAAVNDGLKSQAAQQNLAKFSAIAKIGTPEDFKSFLADQTQKWGSIVKLAGAKID